jgi:hypothetical protein
MWTWKRGRRGMCGRLLRWGGQEARGRRGLRGLLRRPVQEVSIVLLWTKVQVGRAPCGDLEA